jgi:serine/threonine protein kinase
MGIVFCAIDRRKTEARDPNPLVAIKILNAELARHPSALIALQREARKAQSLAHPNVTTVFDFDRDADRVFMSMELLRGRSLDVILREVSGQGIGREAALPIIRGVAEGLAYAHRKGIVHSDLKPGNIFLTEEGTAKIMDFGIARAMPSTSPAAEPKDLFDARSLCAYTEAYATEEMVQGADPHPADDVYALGLIAYQLFTGVHPYLHHSAPRARELGLKAFAPKALRRREWRVLERSLSFERKLRPRDAAEFIAQFVGVTRPRKALIAATVLLGVFAAYASYRNYRQGGPVVDFEELPQQTQQEFQAFTSDGDRLWKFYENDENLLALQEALEQYANAYELHAGNRQAVRALQRVAKAALKATRDRPEQRREFARALAQRSEYLATYPPVVAASK